MCKYGIFVAKMCKYGIFVAKMCKYGIFVAKIYKYAPIDSFQGFSGSLDSAANCAALVWFVFGSMCRILRVVDLENGPNSNDFSSALFRKFGLVWFWFYVQNSLRG